MIVDDTYHNTLTICNSKDVLEPHSLQEIRYTRHRVNYKSLGSVTWYHFE